MAEKEYIERNELIKNLNYFAPEHYSALINDLIMKQPAADVAPARHGEWEYQPPTATLNGAWKCTACKCYFWEHTANEFKYCPNCGAKMDRSDNA